MLRLPRHHILFILIAPILILWPFLSCFALAPDEVAVVCNREVSESVKLARYYLKKRGIPKKNLVTIKTTDAETCSRREYNTQIAAPVRKFLQDYRPQRHIRCLVLMYGIPLRVLPPEASPETKKQIEVLKEKERELKELLKSLKGEEAGERQALKKELDGISKKRALLSKSNHLASVDSELALVLKQDYPLADWVVNPFFLGSKNEKDLIEKKFVLMVSRLDGPSPGTVRRVIDDSLAAEKTGLIGKAYFDARWSTFENIKTNAYEYFDRSIHQAADTVEKSGRMPVVIEKTQELFQPGQCPETALYCGWYSLGKYVDAFQWQPGAIGYHIASSECTTLKKAGSRVWCKKMLEKGIAATIGPVGEPYVSGFPLPQIFFGYLVDGYLTLAECYLISLPYLSWKMVLIGDPLYRPFMNN